MPVYSMTGYASAQHSTAKHQRSESKTSHPQPVGLEIRSVNSRFLDLSFRLPEDCGMYEPALRDLLIAQIKRGKVEVRASIEASDANAIVDPTTRLLQRLNGAGQRQSLVARCPGTLSVCRRHPYFSG
jgi:uncharacterized protein (TIGR00255 family)